MFDRIGRYRDPCACSRAGLRNQWLFSSGLRQWLAGDGGVGFALAQDALVTASNPALLLMLGNRLDVGVDWIQPKRDATIVGNQFVGTPLVTLVPVLSADAQYDGNGRRNFFLPEIGVVRRLSPNLRFGFAIFGNGGLNTDYAVNPYGAFQLQGEKTGAGVDLQQVFVAPSLSLRLNCYFAVGISPNLVYQRVKVFGLRAFATKGINVPGTALNVPGWSAPIRKTRTTSPIRVMTAPSATVFASVLCSRRFRDSTPASAASRRSTCSGSRDTPACFLVTASSMCRPTTVPAWPGTGTSGWTLAADA